MLKADPNLPLRLALSHRAKALDGLARCKRDLESGSGDKQSLGLQILELEHELARAEATIRKLRDAERISSTRLEANLSIHRDEQAGLPEAVRRGAISASGANDANRNLRRRIRAVEEGIAAAKARITAETPEELGGRIDLPFEKYQGEIPYVPKPAGVMEWALALILALLAGGSVFLPWVTVGGAASSLIGISGAIERSMDPSLGYLRLVWLPLFVLPFASIPCFSVLSKQFVGWGILILGMLLTAASLLPGLLIRHGDLGDSLFDGVPLLFHVGNGFYCGVGVAFIVMGGLRVGSASISLKHRLTAAALFAGAMALLVLAVMVLVSLGNRGARITFTASLAQPTQDAIRVLCQNSGG
ncbi:MAG: hypothetical protein WC655_29685, partial [Candidatus Hydrogenedentales bacterium]